MTAVLETALALAGSGRSVFIINASKKPLTPRGFHDASRDPSVIRGWFGKNPNAGLAVPMGEASGLWCLDVDAEKVNPVTGEVTPSGEEALAALVDRHGPLPDTLEQRTGGGGRQLFFRWPPGLRVLSRTGDVAPGLDTRGAEPNGQATGYCALPPSRHYTGNQYVWTNPIGEGVPDFAAAALAPPWLLFFACFTRRDRDALAEIGITGPEGFGGLPALEWPARAAQLLAEAEAKRTTGTTNGPERPAASDGDARERYARAAIGAELDALALTAPGAQDVEMNNAALQVWSLLKSANLEGEADAFRALYLDACRRLPNQPGRERWTERDFQAKWDRARDAARPRDLSHVEEGWSFEKSAFGRTRDGARPGAGEEGKAGGVGGGAKASASPGECLPLFPPLPPAAPYPVEALGPLARVAEAIAAKVQVPPALAAQSVLAAASLAVQAHADVVLPFGQRRPLSQFLVTAAATGDRKTTSDNEACRPVHKREKALAEEREEDIKTYRIELAAWEAEHRRIEKKNLDFNGRREALRFLGDEPEPPLFAFLTAPDPTIEGLVKEWPKAHPALGIFTAEGGQFTGGHAMSDDSRLRSAAALSAIWDGAPIKRVRALDGVSVLRGRRLALHLMLQPGAATEFLSHPVLRDQGLLSRMLVAAPESLAGSRMYREATAEEEAAIRAYSARILAILEARPAMAEGKRNELESRALPLSAEAKRLYRTFHDHVEEQVGPGGPLRPVRDLAAKAAEHAARIAGVLTLVADLGAEEIGEGAMGDGAELVSWYLGEALRMQAAGRTDPTLLQAKSLLDWLQGRADERGEVASRDALQSGPGGLRTKAALESALKVLADHGWTEEASARPRRIRVWFGSGEGER